MYQTAEGFVQSPSVANAASAAQATNRNNTDSPISPMRYDAQNAADSGQEEEEYQGTAFAPLNQKAHNASEHKI